MFFILQQLETLQHDKFPIKIVFTLTVNKAQQQTLKCVGVYPPSPIFPPMASSMWHFPEPLHWTSNIVYREVLWSLKNIKKCFLIIYFFSVRIIRTGKVSTYYLPIHHYQLVYTNRCAWSTNVDWKASGARHGLVAMHAWSRDNHARGL